jgi:RNA polymerase sigma-70 factor (ECF subfamily)
MNTMTVEQLYAKYGPTIYARSRRLLRNSAAAEDATQEVFLKVLRHIDSAPGPDAVLPWIHRITTNYCLNVLRDARRRAKPMEHVPEQVDADFEDSLVTRDFAYRLLASTPEKVRAPALLYYGQGLEQGKVATTLGVSRRTVLYRLAEFTRQMMHLDALAEAGEA